MYTYHSYRTPTKSPRYLQQSALITPSSLAVAAAAPVAVLPVPIMASTRQTQKYPRMDIGLIALRWWATISETSGSTFDAPIIPITNPTGAAPAAELGDDNVDKDTTSSGEYSEDIKRHLLDIYTQCRRLL